MISTKHLTTCMSNRVETTLLKKVYMVSNTDYSKKYETSCKYYHGYTDQKVYGGEGGKGGSQDL